MKTTYYLDAVNELLFNFYTSDNIGDFEIALEGFIVEVKAVSINEIFSVSE